jgi:hypothetical protein
MDRFLTGPADIETIAGRIARHDDTAAATSRVKRRPQGPSSMPPWPCDGYGTR